MISLRTAIVWIVVVIVVTLAIALLYHPAPAHAMGSTQFGSYTQAYLDRQKCRADARAAGRVDLCGAKKLRR